MAFSSSCMSLLSSFRFWICVLSPRCCFAVFLCQFGKLLLGWMGSRLGSDSWNVTNYRWRDWHRREPFFSSVSSFLLTLPPCCWFLDLWFAGWVSRWIHLRSVLKVQMHIPLFTWLSLLGLRLFLSSSGDARNPPALWKATVCADFLFLFDWRFVVHIRICL